MYVLGLTSHCSRRAARTGRADHTACERRSRL